MPRVAVLLPVLLPVLWALSLNALSVAGSSAPPAQPNLLLILADDLNAAELDHMPYVRRLLTARGVSFTSYLASVSLCCPSRATMLRGQYAHNTRVLNNGEGTDDRGGFAVAHRTGLEASTVATWLQDAGYHTALVGKYLNGYPDPLRLSYVPPGWSDWYSPSAGTPYSEFEYVLNENGRLVRYGDRPQDYGTDVYAAKAEGIIRRAAARSTPFFVLLSVYAPHVPATPAPRHAHLFPNAKAPRTPSYDEADVSDKPAFIRRHPLLSAPLGAAIDELYRLRLRSLQAVDEAVARLVRVLDETGVLAHTYVIFASDNGYHLGQHRLSAGKRTAYEEDIRLPLVVRGPGVPAGAERAHLVGNIDLAPTLAALAGAAVPGFVDGRSFAPLLRSDPPPPAAWRQVYLLEHWTEGKRRAPRGVDEPLDHDRYEDPLAAHPFVLGRAPLSELPPAPLREANGIPDFHGLRSATHTYVAYRTGERELYDLKRDPFQLQNLAASTPAGTTARLLERAAARTAALARCRAQTCRALEDEPLAP